MWLQGGGWNENALVTTCQNAMKMKSLRTHDRRQEKHVFCSPLGVYDSQAHASLGQLCTYNITTTDDGDPAFSTETQGSCNYGSETRCVCWA